MPKPTKERRPTRGMIERLHYLDDALRRKEPVTCPALAKHFGVSRWTIQRLLGRRRVHWHVRLVNLGPVDDCRRKPTMAVPRTGILIALVCLLLSGARSYAGTDMRPVAAALTVTDLAEIRRKADPWLKSTDDVALRKSLRDVTSLIDTLLAQGKAEEALPYLERVLKANPSDFAYQLTYGEILARRGEPESLRWRALQGVRHAEDDATIRRAYALADKQPPPKPPELPPSSADEVELVIVKLGAVSDFWLYDLRDALADRLGIPVTVASLYFDLGPPDRTQRERFLADRRQRLLQHWESDATFARFLSSQSISKDSLATKDDEAIIRALRALAQMEGPAVVQQLDQRLDDMQYNGHQWNADRLLAGLRETVKPYARPNRGLLVVTDRDLYSGSNNFLFGIAYNGGGLGLISAVRFAARFQDEAAKRERLTMRLVKQGLSTYGFMLNVGRCTNPDCARSYPNSLAEHDAKSDRLCDECRVGFERKLGHSLPSTP